MSYAVPAYPIAEKVLPRRLYFLRNRAKALSVEGMSGLLTIKGDTQAAELEHFTFLERISLEGITDAGMAHLGGLTRLRELSISESPRLTGKGLAHLSGVRQLKDLRLLDTSVDDAGLYHLRNLNQLEGLILFRSRVVGSGFQHLSGLNQLKRLEITESPFTDIGLRHIAAFKRLESLFLNETRVGDDGVQYLEGMSQLTMLGLSGTQVKGSGFASLSPSTRIQHFDVSNTPLTDAAIDPLIRIFNAQPSARFPPLLDVSKTRLTAVGVKRLRRACPNVKIYSDHDQD